MKSYNRYCTYCGVENKKKNKRCMACNKKLDTKDALLKEYLINNTKESLQLTIDNNFISILFRYFRCHLFGLFEFIVFMTCFVICVYNLSGMYVVKKYKVESVNNIKNLRSCSIVDAVPVTYTCPEGYQLEYKECIKYNLIDANVTKACEKSSEMFDGRCFTKATTEFIDGQGCPDYVEGQDIYYKYNAQIKKCNQYRCSSINYTNEQVICNSVEENTGVVIDLISKKVCPNEYQPLKGTCKKETKLIDEYYCISGDLTDNKCKVKEITSSTIKCNTGYVLDEKCNICIKEQ